MNSACKIGVVTVTYNGIDYLEPFFRDCWRQTHANFVLYVVDNDSKDGTLEFAKSQTDTRCQVITHRRNVGFAEGCNIAIRQAQQDGCDTVLLLNNDVEFPETLFADLLGELIRLKCAMIAPKIYFSDRPNVFWSAGAKFSRLWGWTSVHRGEGLEDTGQFDEPQRVENAPGCCILIEIGLFKRIGLLDPKYFVYFEDTDFCLRAFRAGEPLYFTPKTHLFHKVSSATGGTDSPFTLKMYSRNKVYYLLKNFGIYAWGWITAYLVYVVLMGVLGKRGGWATMTIRLKKCLEGIRLAYAQPHHLPG